MITPPTSEKSIFLQALELITVSEREAYLDTQCGSDAGLRSEVEELLRHQGDVGSFLESPPTAVVDSAEQLHTIAPLQSSLGFLTPSARSDSLGRLGHFEILEVVGSGGMGIVLRAFDERLQRVVAIKAMAPSLAASATGRQRFVREAQAAAAVNHDNVVDIYAVEAAGPVPYLAMEYIAGISLEDKLKQQGPLELKEILRIGLQTADGLAAAHRQGLVHRDVKPANILLENGVGRVKITDFGLARAADDVSVSQTGVIAGTPAYMSPEQARGDALDHRSDLFSLGSVLYAMCAGRTPFRGSTSLGVLKQICEEQPHPLRDLNSDIPEWLCLVVERLHAKLPGERFQSAAELAELLSRQLAHVQNPSLAPLPSIPVGNALCGVPALDGDPAGPRGAAKGILYKSRRRWAIAAVAALVVLALTLSLTDASGITHVAATVIRIFTPDGVLVVEVDDPAVKVTIEGDGGLIIRGAGAQEVHVKPGSYKIQATKDGQRVPVDQELVTITRGGKQVVKVRREEGPASQALSQEQKLEQARLQLEEADRLYKLGEPLRGSDPWQAELHFRKAVAIYEKLGQDFPESPASKQKLAACRWGLGSALQTQAKLLVIQKQPPATVEEARRAVTLANEAIALVPKDMGMRISLGAAHYRARDWKSALAALEQADLLRDVDGTQVYHGCMNWLFLAMVHWQLGDKVQARHWLDRADQSMEANHRNDEILLRLRAEAFELLGISPDERVARAQNVVLAELAGYDATLTENPNDLATVLKRGDVLRRLKRYDDAVAALSRVISNASDSSQRAAALQTRAMTHAERGHLQGTIEDYEECLRPGSEEAWMYGRLATCYSFGPEKLRNPQRALEHAETAIQKRDANLNFHTLHGVCLYRQGRYRDAIEVLERTYEGKDHTAMNRFFAAMTYQNLGDPAKAQQCYALALKLPQPTGHPGMIPDWVELMRAEAEAVLKIQPKSK